MIEKKESKANRGDSYKQSKAQICCVLGSFQKAIKSYIYLESLHCSPKTVTTVLIGYTPIQNKKLKKKKEKSYVYLILAVNLKVVIIPFPSGNKETEPQDFVFFLF